MIDSPQLSRANIQTSASGHLKLHMTAVLMLRNPPELAELKTQLQQPDA